MPNVDISEDNFVRLQKFATPLVDTMDTALAKVLALAERNDQVNAQGANPSEPPSARSSFSSSAPDLTFTNIQSVVVNGKTFPPAMCKWNALMLHVIETAGGQLPKGSSVSDLVVVNHVVGQKEDDGYKFLKSVGVSVQGQTSNNAWKAIRHIAKATGMKIEVSFAWNDNPKAARPGQAGKLIV